MPSAVTYTFVDGPGHTASGAQVSQNFADAVAGMDGLEAATGIPNPQTKPKMRGASVIGTTGTRTNVAYGGLSDGPDQVTGIVLPTNGLLAVAFQAAWQESVASAARAAIFIGANQLKVAAQGQTAPLAQEAVGPGGTPGSYAALSSYADGLNWIASTSYTADVTTGQAVGIQGASGQGSGLGGPCYIFAAAGTYTISVQFRSTSGSVTVKDRKLWVWAVGF